MRRATRSQSRPASSFSALASCFLSSFTMAKVEQFVAEGSTPARGAKKAQLSVSLLYPSVFAVLIATALGLTIALSTLSHLQTVNDLVGKLQSALGADTVNELEGMLNQAYESAEDVETLVTKMYDDCFPPAASNLTIPPSLS